MGKKSIYVSIPCLGFDYELITTIKTCILNSSKKNDIKIHIACTGNKDFYNMTRVQSANFKNVDVSFFELEGNYGIGKGRKHAAQKYNNEDYFLEIDAHTYFDQDWDQILIDTFEDAVVFSNNSKTVITSYLPGYKPVVGGYEKQDIRMPFMYWEKDETIRVFNMTTDTMCDTKIPKWGTVDMPEGSKKLEVMQELFNGRKFIPSIKICGQFIFGNSHFGKDTRLDENALFWEEEIFQSVELIGEGFTLLYPNISPVLYHYNQEPTTTTSRITFYQLCDELKIDPIEYLNNMKEVYKKYILNLKNIEKIKKYAEYSGIDLTNNKITSSMVEKNIYFKNE
jgi:Glycosyltransferase (GlcNAc)